jgi:CheY-like chemotaxis protein
MPLKLLVVDHDPATLELIQEVCSLRNAEVCALRDGVLAVAPIAEQKFDGFLLEVNMPQLDGLRLARLIRESSRNGRVPIIHMSAQSNAQIVHRAYESGGTFFLVKPLDRARLSRLLRATSGIMLQERRRYWRIPLAVPLHCESDSRQLSGCSVRNLSATGMLFRGDGSLNPGSKVYLAFPLSEKNRRSMISTWGKVVRVDDSGQVGVRFTKLGKVDHQRILERIAVESDAA